MPRPLSFFVIFRKQICMQMTIADMPEYDIIDPARSKYFLIEFQKPRKLFIGHGHVRPNFSLFVSRDKLINRNRQCVPKLAHLLAVLLVSCKPRSLDIG